MKIKMVYMILAVITALTLAGCNDIKDNALQNEAETSELSIEETEDVMETDVVISEEDSNPPVLEEEYKFDENFDMVLGETVNLEGGITFYLETSEYVNDSTRVTYMMSADGQNYPGIYFLYADQTTWNATEVYNPYPIDFVSEDNGTATFCIHKKADVKQATVLSNNAEDSYTTTDYEYIEGNRCNLYLMPGITVSGDVVESIDVVMTELESQTKYSFDEETRISHYRTENIRENYYGVDQWPGVDNFHEKTAIYIVENYEEGSTDHRLSCAMNNVVVLTEDDFNTLGWRSALTHELTHVLFMRHCNDFEDKLEEGLACYYAREVMLALPQYPADSSINEDYYADINSMVGGEYKLNAKTAEELFLTEFAHRDSNTYSIGMYFVTYLMENYTLDELHRFFISIDKKALEVDDYTPPTIDMQMEALKDIYGEDVFTTFGKWYENNCKRFQP